jgi:hypothetical protein
MNTWLQWALLTAQSALNLYLLSADPSVVPAVNKLLTDIQALLNELSKPAP